MTSLDSAESYVRQLILVHVLVRTSPLLRIKNRRYWCCGPFKSAGIYHAVYVHLYRLPRNVTLSPSHSLATLFHTGSFATLCLTTPSHTFLYCSLPHQPLSLSLAHTLSHYLITSPSFSSSVTLPLIFPLPLCLAPLHAQIAASDPDYNFAVTTERSVLEESKFEGCAIVVYKPVSRSALQYWDCYSVCFNF